MCRGRLVEVLVESQASKVFWTQVMLNLYWFSFGPEAVTGTSTSKVSASSKMCRAL
jgi:hypothetical protein